MLSRAIETFFHQDLKKAGINRYCCTDNYGINHNKRVVLVIDNGINDIGRYITT